MSRPKLIAMTLLALTYGAGAGAQPPEPPSPPAPNTQTSAPATAVPAATAAAEAGSPVPTSEEASKAPPAAPAAKGSGPASAADGSKTASGSPRGAKSSDRLELSTTEISGNRELPKVLYVVPWRRADIGDAVGRPPNSLVEEALTPVDREVFRRQNRYYATLQSGAAPAKSQPAAAGGVPPHAAPKDER